MYSLFFFDHSEGVWGNMKNEMTTYILEYFLLLVQLIITAAVSLAINGTDSTFLKANVDTDTFSLKNSGNI